MNVVALFRSWVVVPSRLLFTPFWMPIDLVTYVPAKSAKKNYTTTDVCRSFSLDHSCHLQRTLAAALWELRWANLTAARKAHGWNPERVSAAYREIALENARLASEDDDSYDHKFQTDIDPYAKHTPGFARSLDGTSPEAEYGLCRNPPF